MLHLQGSTVSDLSNDSSPAHGYPDFPASPSPESIFGENASASTLTNNPTNNQSSSHY